MTKEMNKWGISLIDKAGEKVGSFYKLAEMTGIAESNISSVRSGRRKMPLSWVVVLADIAKVDALEYHRQILMEQAPKNEKGDRLRERLGKAAAAGAAAMLLFFYSNGLNFTTETIAANVDALYIVLSIVLAFVAVTMGRCPIPPPNPTGRTYSVLWVPRLFFSKTGRGFWSIRAFQRLPSGPCWAFRLR